MRSLLVRYGLAMASAVLVAFLVPLGLLARTLSEERALSAAHQEAQQIAMVVDEPVRLEAALSSLEGRDRHTTVFLPDGRTLGEAAARSAAVALAATGQAFTARTTGGAEVLVPVAGPAGVVVVRTFVPDSALTAGVGRAWAILGVVGVTLLAATAIAGDRIAARLSRSVRDLATVADRLGSGDLSARVVPSGPAEVRSVGTVLNGLGERVVGLLADERELVADLSHRLRTPITALRLDVDMLPPSPERVRLGEHVDGLVAAVNAVIATARDHDRDRAATGCDLAEVVRDRVRFWSVLASAQQRALESVIADAPAPVSAEATEIGAALDVLIENVFAHTPAGSPLRITVATTGATAAMSVSDAGPGFDPDLAVTRGSSGAGSSGLGLDVARRTAAAHGGSFLVRTGLDGRGSEVIVTLPIVLARP